MFNLETAVGRGRVCGYWGAGQGAARRNGYSIPTSCNAARRRQNRAIRPVATSHPIGERKIYEAFNKNRDVAPPTQRSTAVSRFKQRGTDCPEAISAVPKLSGLHQTEFLTRCLKRSWLTSRHAGRHRELPTHSRNLAIRDGEEIRLGGDAGHGSNRLPPRQSMIVDVNAQCNLTFHNKLACR